MPKKSNFKILWTFSANRDLESIVDFIARDNPTAARLILDSLRKRADTLKTFPERGRVVPELAHVGLYIYRELLVNPWRLVYRVSNAMVYVMMVIDGRRNVEDLLLERLLRK